MRLATAAFAAMLGAAAAGSARGEDWAAVLHAEAMQRLPTYANETRPKVMVACIRWEGASGRPEIVFATTSVSDRSRPARIDRLRTGAMRSCNRRAATEGCDCATLDEAGRNVLRVPGS